MVGYHPTKYELTKRDHAISGAVSGVITRAMCQPLDVIKIRFQLQTEPISKAPKSKYYSIRQSFRSIIREEGYQALWKGHLTAQLFTVVYGPATFVSFEILTKQAWNYLPEHYSTDYRPITHFVCGGISGCVASVACQPFDVTRTRLVAQGEPKIYNGILHAWKCMLAEGPLTFYKGLVPTLVQVAPYSGLQFGVYSLFKNIWNMTLPDGEHHSKYAGMLESLICGFGAGVVAKGVIYPFDLIKKRLQVQGFEEARKTFGKVRHYTGLSNCTKCIIRDEGLKGLYKGLSPSLIKAAAVTGLAFFAYEQCCSFIVMVKSS
ncbi:unnamed protein product [Owenia fusiformis]|uniref:Mitochondrial thiamine pyrophosphate carrier n=1 Tax=Owenia fusiformis TaxID=6347 RepID=A0A8S4PNW1_OWEFU|nr:unnamed protein product [Owenia fusiformis]